MSKLFKLKEWFTLDETARHLSVNFGEEVTKADVLRLALDGHLVLSVDLQSTEMGHCGKLIPIADAEFQEFEFEEGKPPSRIYGGIVLHTGDEETDVLKFDDKVVRLRGVYDLPMIGGEKNEVENQYREFVGGQRISLTSLDGVFVQAGDDEFVQILEDFDDNEFQSGSAAQLDEIEALVVHEKLSDDKANMLRLKHKADRLEFLKKGRDDPRRYYPAGGLGRDAVFVVRNESLTKFLREVAEDDGDKSLRSIEDKPLGTTERNTLLTIIAVLAKEAKVPLDDYSKPGKAAGYIEGLTDEFGAHVSKRAIEEHLKKIPDALATRMK